MDHAWTCHCCGKEFTELQLDFACLAPDPWLDIPMAERDSRGKLGSDFCVIDDKYIFVRGCIEIPVIGHTDTFAWGVWVSVSRQSFERMKELMTAVVIEGEPGFFGWLCNNIAIYPRTYGLKTQVQVQSRDLRPLIELEPTDHPLAVEQRNGISLDRVKEIVAALRPH